MENPPSLIVKLPLRLCSTCTEILSRWCEPPLPSWLPYGLSSWQRAIPEEYLKKRLKGPRWVLRPGDLKRRAEICMCCRFFLQCLDSGPWMAYDDDDYAVVESHFLGTTHTDFSMHKGDGDVANSGALKSQYDRVYRPRLEIFKRTLRDGKTLCVPSGFLFIIPLPGNEGLKDSQTRYSFLARLVDKTIDAKLVQGWFAACQRKHAKDRRPRDYVSRPYCVVTSPKVAIPNFRLVDVQERCIVTAESNNKESYAALSYVWGSAKRLLLSKNNLTKLSTVGSLSPENNELPRTFCDAFAVADMLGIQYVWIDALCILQDDEYELAQQMKCMNTIYGSAILTIVSDTDNADSGIPGISYPRQSAQAAFRLGDQTFLSSKRTFGAALTNSPWESRGWCLQEKIFSLRLLICTSTQVFYSCNRTIWFEDIIMEDKNRGSENVHLAERPNRWIKGQSVPQYTAYESHRMRFGENGFWSLIETYSRRNLSYESDAIRAFSGILESLQAKHGAAIRGVPRYSIPRGLSWGLHPHNMALRRSGFPSWSWAGWRGNAGSRLKFSKVSSDLYNYIWDIECYYYDPCDTGEHTLTLANNSSDTSYEDREEQRKTNLKRKKSSRWMIPRHPGEVDYSSQEVPAFHHDTATMPPLAHILHMYTSTVNVTIDPQPIDGSEEEARDSDSEDGSARHYKLYATSTGKELARVQLDPNWSGIGGEATLIYVSRGYDRITDYLIEQPLLLNILLVEGTGQIQTLVTDCGAWDISLWRKANPAWKLVTLA